MGIVRAGVAGAVAVMLIGSVSSAPILTAQETGRAVGRTEKGLYLLKVVEPGYDVTITETERGPTFSVLDANGLVPTVTAGGTVLFRAIYDIAKERGFEYTFTLPPREGQAPGASARGSDGRRLALVTKVFMTKDPKAALKDLLGADYSPEAQQLFDLRGYMSVAQLALLFGGRW